MATGGSFGSAQAFELRFESLFRAGHGYAFPCDANGHVDVERLSERGRRHYLAARAMVGREYATPAIRRTQQAITMPSKEVRHGAVELH